MGIFFPRPVWRLPVFPCEPESELGKGRVSLICSSKPFMACTYVILAGGTGIQTEHQLELFQAQPSISNHGMRCKTLGR